MPLVPFFIGFFEFGQGHRGPMIPYCPGAPGVVSLPLVLVPPTSATQCPAVPQVSAHHQCQLISA
ncbi:unnamed protein product, partial [Staurois parvus]